MNFFQAQRIFLWIFYLGLIFSGGNANLDEDKRSLLEFLKIMSPTRLLNWNESSSLCNTWTGITCSHDGSRISAVRLPGLGLNGQIPPNTISRLSGLRVLSLRSNRISGQFPADFINLKNLSFLYLQHNLLTGPLPEDFSVWTNLTSINLSDNRFNGTIPDSLSGLQHVDLSNNSLTGSIPQSLQRFPTSSFSGNNLISSIPLVPSSTAQPRLNPKSHFLRLNQTSFLLITIAVCIIVVSTVTYIVTICCLRKKLRPDGISDKLQKGEMSPEKMVSRMEDKNNRLNFFDGCHYAFDLEDLLTASAEILGKGTFGITYKAVLEDVTAVAVKRLKEVAVGKRDFEQQMEIIGGIKHGNVVELKAYFYSKDEKLMVYDYFNGGSVSSMIHGNRGDNRTPLDWETRMRIAVGAAKGIARIHEENNGKFIHGNIKSANIFLNNDGNGCVSDLGLSAVMTPLPPPIYRQAGYRAPEVTDTRKSSQAADVYSFGVVLLELLTGKSPIYTTAGDEMIHLVRWVQSVVREEWTAEVFDVELLKYSDIEGEMVEMLQIAMSCVVRVADHRPKMSDLVKLIDDVRPL